MELNEKIIDTLTGEEIIRPYNAEEIAEYEKAQAELAAKELEKQKNIAAKLVLLGKLGITEEEAKLLLS